MTSMKFMAFHNLARTVGLCLSLALLVTAAKPAQASVLLTNGGFETGDFTGWTVTNLAGGSGSFFVASGASTPLSVISTVGPSSGIFYAVSDQTGPGTHALTQSFTVDPSCTVILTFDMFVNNYGGVVIPGILDHTGSAIQHARVDILTATASAFDTGAGVLLNVYDGADAGPNPNPYTSYSIDISSVVAAGGTFQIRFAESDNQGFLHQGIDNVSLRCFDCPVPEPSSLTLLGLGAFGMVAGAIRRRRQTKAIV